MIEELKILIEMQKLDDKIHEKNKIKKDLPKQLKNLKDTLQQAETKMNTTKNDLQENQKSQQLEELEISENKEKIAKYKNQLLTIKTNKEYKALNSEISHLELKNSGIDDNLIELMETEADKKNQLKEDKKSFEAAEAELKKNEEKLNIQIEKVIEEIKKLRSQRNTLAEDLPLNIVKRYAALIKNKNNKAVVFNEKNACGGCGFNIRPQQVIEINEGRRIVNCESCGRMIVPQEAEK